ncbi:MAG: hypothetical protein RDU13_06705 [Elusimicrobiales bacterium]|nr:hypothetical protein [Elusimicrobiales bacterium]
MMKKLTLILAITAVLAGVGAGPMAGRLSAATAESSRIFTPFFDMTLSENGYLPSEGNLFSGGSINTQVGLLAKVTEKDQVFGLYNFNYGGPGFAPQDTRQFTDRSLTHGFNFEYRRSLGGHWRVRPGVSFSKDYTRSGANEAWDQGLYNTESKGFQLAVDYSFDAERNGFVTAQFLTRSIKFPNYGDLLAEFNNPSNTSELSGGQQDQRLTQVSLRPNWNKFFGGVTFTTQDFDNQLVVGSGGVYTGEKQKDTSTALDFGFHHSLWIFELYPTVSYTVRDSNQNYVRYKFLGAAGSLTDPSGDVYFMADNYSYSEMAFVVPVDLNITSKWAVGGAMSVVKRDYDSRLRRDASNNYIAGEKQENTMTTLTGSIRKRINDVAMVRLSYSLVVASSNNEFEQYMPYNYTGNSFGISYQLSY